MFNLFSYRAFRDLWIGQAISRLGDALYFLGFPFMVSHISSDPAMVGYVGAVEAIPFLLVGPHAGALADRMDRKRIMLLSDLISSVLLLLFALVIFAAGSPPLWSLFVFGFLLSICRVVFMPAKNAAIPNVVPEKEIVRANSFNMGTDQAVWLSMMALAGGVLASIYSYKPIVFYLSFIVVNLLSFIGSAVFLARLPVLKPEREEVHHPWKEIADGFRYVKTQHVIKLSTLAQIGVSLSIAPFFTVYLLTNKRWFGDNPATLAWIECSFVGGMFLVSMIVMKLQLKRVGLAWAGGIGVAGVTILMMAFSHDIGAFIFWNILAGMAIGFVDIPMTSYIQMIVPDELRGRVMSLRMIVMMGTMPIGMALGGKLLAQVGISNMYAIMGGLFALSGFACLSSKPFRDARLPEPTEAAIAEVAEEPANSTLVVPGGMPVETAAPMTGSIELAEEGSADSDSAEEPPVTSEDANLVQPRL